MRYRKIALYSFFILAVWGISALSPVSALATGSSTSGEETKTPNASGSVAVPATPSPATCIDEAKAAIENARQADAEKSAPGELTQARYWLMQAEKNYAHSRSLWSQSLKLIISDEAKTQEILYLATMARITAQTAEAKARKALVATELTNTAKDLADNQAMLDVLNKKLAEAELAKKVKAEAEAEQKKLEQARQEAAVLESKKMKELEEARKKAADLEAAKQKELSDANLKGQQLVSEKAKQEAELKTLQQKLAALDKAKAMLADAVKIPGATVKAVDKEIVINISASKIFSSKNEIHAKGKSTLDEVASYLKKYPEGAVMIRCYSDNAGKAEAQRLLTEKRAVKVKGYLVDFHNIAPDRIVAKGLGPTQPIADNSTASGRALNRRVEIGVAFGE
ncbi:MAG TPA: OmpA family protein [Syntrophales bacterium]|nr:OmpA family protein [Syntrophales bacterium]